MGNVQVKEVKQKYQETVSVEKKEKDVFPIMDLPDDAIERILYFLSYKDKKNMRLASSWFDRKVSDLYPSLFKTLRLPLIMKENIAFVDRTLITMMEKYPTTHSEIRLKVDVNSSVEKFDIEAKKKEFLVRYSSNIYQLWLSHNTEEDFWHHIRFPNMERLFLAFPFSLHKTFKGIDFAKPILCKDSALQMSYESLIMNHAENLKTLFIKNLNDLKLDVITPMSNLERLTLKRVRAETAFALIYACRSSLEYLEFQEMFNISTVIKTLSQEDYKLTKLNSFAIRFDYLEFYTPFICSNADQLTGLGFHGVKTTLQNIEWPQLLNLTALYIGESDSLLLSILSRCATTLKVLIINSVVPLVTDFQMILPSLSKLSIFGKQSLGLATKLILNNMETIEYICLDRHTVSIIDQHFWMVLVKVKLVLIFDFEQKMSKPNAQSYINSWMEVCPVGKVYYCSSYRQGAEIINSYGKGWYTNSTASAIKGGFTRYC